MCNRIAITFLALICWGYATAAAAVDCSINVDWGYAPPDQPAVTGFRLYQEGIPVCETHNPDATTMDCTLTLVEETTTFTMVALFADGSESDHSEPYLFSFDGEEPTQPVDPPVASAPVAEVVASTQEGSAPLTVSFDGSSSSGQIASYGWDFGDGAAASGSNVAHTYTLPGSYASRLTVTDSDGNMSSDTITITVTEAPVTNTAPKAVILCPSTGTTSTAIVFDGSGSTDTEGTVASYEWSFGDGSSASGEQVTHTFATAATYSVSLTVADSQGVQSTTSLPIIITAPVVETNQPPQAAVSVSAASGQAPFTLTLNGSGSSDSDGTIETYAWDFGDGDVGIGVAVTHTYTAEGIYTATLQVTDNKGSTAFASTTITVDSVQDDPSPGIEVGEVTVNGEWKRVELEKMFAVPIVIAGPPTYNGTDPGVIRLRNVDQTGFEIKFEEWDYLDGSHLDETVSYLVVEKGRHSINGSIIEAGSITGTTTLTAHSFDQPFAFPPVVLTTVASESATDTIAGRLQDVTGAGFAYAFREQELHENIHPAETVHYVALQKGGWTMGNMSLEVITTAEDVNHGWKGVTYQNTGEQLPFLFADMQTTNGGDTSALRVTNQAKGSFQVRVEEEQSRESETGHTNEVVGYLAIRELSQAQENNQADADNTAVEPVEENHLSAVEVGEVTVNGEWKRVELEKMFTHPIVIAGPPTYNGGDPGVIRLRNVDQAGFEIKFEEWDYLDGSHLDETVSYLVVEKGRHVINGSILEAGTITGTTTLTAHSFDQPFAFPPVVLTTVASESETDTIAGRIQDVTGAGFAYAFREQELHENIHPAETVHYVALQKGGGVMGNMSFEVITTAENVNHGWKGVTYQNTGEQLPFLFADMQTTNGGDTSALRVTNQAKGSFQVRVEEEQSRESETGHTNEVVGYLAIREVNPAQ